MKRFILLSNQRSGSTFLRIWLNSHTQIASHGVVFLGHYRSPDGFNQYCHKVSHLSRIIFFLHNTKLMRKAGLDLITYSMIDNYLDKLYQDPSHPAPWTDINKRNNLARKVPASVTGFKLMYGTLEFNAALRKWIDDQSDLMVIQLIRNNLLKSYISGQRMQLNRVAHTTDQAFTYTPVTINMKNMLLYFETTVQNYQFYSNKYSNTHSYLELTYEDIFSDQAATLRKLLNFFSLQAEPMPIPPMKKIGSAILKNEVANYQEG